MIPDNSQGAPGAALPKVLLIEDTIPIRKLLSVVFQRFGFEVLEAGDGAEALQQLARGLPDIILCDLLMPVMDGRTFLQRVKSDDRFKQIPVILLSADFSPSLERELTAAGADKLMLKTGAHTELVQAVKDRLAAAAAARPGGR